jgi:hypothetical protein
LSPWQPLLSVVQEKGVCTTLDSVCHYKESKFGESLRTHSASLRIYVKETVTRTGLQHGEGGVTVPLLDGVEMGMTQGLTVLTGNQCRRLA